MAGKLTAAQGTGVLLVTANVGSLFEDCFFFFFFFFFFLLRSPTCSPRRVFLLPVVRERRPLMMPRELNEVFVERFVRLRLQTPGGLKTPCEKHRVVVPGFPKRSSAGSCAFTALTGK
ncbi:hypothetical protein EYF80_054092 [Liparis tanakae]|uniref:Uncharacterized protein n=1 Tax=Liparis tanakae TaxID=230148 RepID=A0A4Z2F3L2_9TELE|nr:hypothetical protein EYF80_054092 [Liparis tanakae]